MQSVIVATLLAIVCLCVINCITWTLVCPERGLLFIHSHKHCKHDHRGGHVDQIVPAEICQPKCYRLQTGHHLKMFCATDSLDQWEYQKQWHQKTHAHGEGHAIHSGVWGCTAKTGEIREHLKMGLHKNAMWINLSALIQFVPPSDLGPESGAFCL